MNTIVVERLHINWDNELKIANYLIVDSLETGLYLANEIVKAEQLSHSNVIICQESENIWIVKHKYELTREQTFIIRVREIEPFTKDIIDSVISKINKSYDNNRRFK